MIGYYAEADGIPEKQKTTCLRLEEEAQCTLATRTNLPMSDQILAIAFMACCVGALPLLIR